MAQTVKTFLALVFSCAFLCGCATPGKSPDLAPLASSAAFTGSALYLAGNPSKRPVFEAAEKALRVLATRDQIGAGDLRDAFGSLLENGIRELRDARTRIIIENVVLLVDAYAGRVDVAADQRLVQVRAIALASADGIRRALELQARAATPAPSP